MAATRTSSQVPAIWEEATKRYEEIAKTRLRDPKLSGVSTVSELVSVIEGEQKRFDQFRSKRRLLIDITQGTLKPIEKVSAAFGRLGAGQGMGVELVFSGVHQLFVAAMGVSAKYDAIVEVLSSLKDFTSRLEIYAKKEMSQQLSDRLTEILVALLDILAISQREIKKGRLLSYGKSIVLGTAEGKLAVDKLRRLTEGEQGLAVAETLTEVKGVTAMVSGVGADVMEIRKRLDAIALTAHEASAEEAKRSRKMDQLDKIRVILQPCTFVEDRYHSINRSRLPGTCDWVRAEPQFGQWVSGKMSGSQELPVAPMITRKNSLRQESPPVLWISGTPGAGKSYIASNLISYLGEESARAHAHAHAHNQTSSSALGYFFFKDDDPKTRSVVQALCDVSYMLSVNDPVYAKYLASRLQSPQDVASLQRVWSSLFVEFFSPQGGGQHHGGNDEDQTDSSTAFVVLDALDEADEQERRLFFEMAGELFASTEGGRCKHQLRLVMLGRPHVYDEIIESMQVSDVPTIHVTGENNSSDISRYIRASIAKSVYLRRVSQKTQREIITKLSRGAQGMFLWVDLMLRVLLKQRNEAAIRKALNEAPRGIDEMIRHVLEGFSASFEDTPDAAEDLNEMLAFVTCAVRPLTLGELDTLLKIRSEDGHGMIWLERTLRLQFASFFALKREDGLTTAELQQGLTSSVTSAVMSPLLLGPGSRSGSGDDSSTNPPRADGANPPSQDLFADPDAATDFDSDLLTTEVSFCHASIGDFFRNEKRPGKARAGLGASDAGGVGADGEGCPRIGVDIHEAHVTCLKRFLTFMCWPTGHPNLPLRKAGSISQYIVSNWMTHVEYIDPRRMSVEDKAIIGPLLAELLLRSEDIIFPSSIYRQEKVAALEKLLSDPEILGSMPDEDRLQFEKALSGNQADILARIGRWNAERWLTPDEKFGTLGYGLSVMHYRRLCAGLSPISPMGEEITVDVINDAAEWLNLERNATWHRLLAVTFREWKFYDQAIEHLRTAIQLEPESHMAHSDLSTVYVAQKNWDMVIQLDRELLKLLDKTLVEPQEAHGVTPTAEQDLWYHRPYFMLYSRLARAFEATGDLASAMDMHRQVLIRDPSDEGAFIGTVGLLCWQKRYAEAFDVLKSLDKPLPRYLLVDLDRQPIPPSPANPAGGPPRPTTGLTASLMKSPRANVEMFAWMVAVDRHVLTMAPDVRDRRFILDAYRAAIERAGRSRKAIVVADLELSYAGICQAHGDFDTAVRIWQHYASLYRSKVGSIAAIADTFDTAVTALAEHCLCRCMEEEQRTTATETTTTTTSTSPSPEFLRHGALLEWAARIPSSSAAAVVMTGDDDSSPTAEEPPPQTQTQPQQQQQQSQSLFLPLDPTATARVSSDITKLFAHYIALPSAGARHAESHELLRQEVRECVRLLSDDDPDNDYDAYRRLGFVLAAVDGGSFRADSDAAMAMAGLLCDEEGSELPDYVGAGMPPAKQTFRNIWPVCDGCFESVALTDMAHCRFCVDVSFCETCLGRMRDGRGLEGGVVVCSRTHEWLRCGRFPAEKPLEKEEEKEKERDKEDESESRGEGEEEEEGEQGGEETDERVIAQEKRRNLIYVRGEWVPVVEWKAKLKARFAL